MIETIGQPTIRPQGIIHCRREWMLGGEPVIEIQHAGARGGGDAPQEVAVKRGRPDHIAATVELKNAPIGARLRNSDVKGIDPGRIDRFRSRAGGRKRNNAFNELQSPPNGRKRDRAAGVTSLEITQA
jgi:hypothetical protein